jgi:hypothetical protein
MIASAYNAEFLVYNLFEIKVVCPKNLNIYTTNKNLTS